MKKNSFRFLFLFLFILGTHLVSKACSPLNVPNLISQSVGNGSLNLTFQSTTIYTGCLNVIDVEIACQGNPFTGNPSATFTTAPVNLTTTPQTYPVMSIDISAFCPGTYVFRIRERNSGTSIASPWSTTYSFTIPGVFNPPQISMGQALPTICPPQTNTLYVNMIADCGGQTNTYSWTPTTGLSCPTCSSTLANPTVTTIYTVVVTGGQLGCWTSTQSIAVVIAPNPPIFGAAYATPASVCSGSTTTVGLSFYNSGGIQWQYSSSASGPWTNIAGGTSYNYTSGPLTSNIYYRAFMTGCRAVDSTNVLFINITPNPTISVTSATICPGQTGIMTGSGATTYSWSPGAFPTGINTGGAAPVTTTQYTVTGTTNGCADTAVATVSVLPSPTATCNNPMLCVGQPILLTSNGGVSYSWSGPLSYTSSLQNPTIAVGAANMSGQYTVVATSAIGCTNAAIATVTVIATPTPQLLSNNPPCDGTALTFTAGSVTSYTWMGPNGFLSYAPQPQINPVSPISAGVYTLIGAVGACTGTSTAYIGVRSLPNPSIQTNAPVCSGSPLTFTGSGGVTYTWTGPPSYTATGQSILLPSSTVANGGAFTLTATGVNGCDNIAIANVTVQPPPAITPSLMNVCFNQPILLTTVAGASYMWTGPNGFSSAAQTTGFASATYSLAGQYTLTEATAIGCTATAVSTVVILNLPQASIVSPQTTLCAGESLTLSGTGGVTYLWNGPNSYSSSAQTAVIPVVPAAGNGIYTLSVSDGSCIGVATRSILVDALPLPVFSTDTTCEGSMLQLLANGPPGYVYQWQGPGGFSTGAGNFTVYPALAGSAGIYTLNVQDGYGCANTFTSLATVYPKPTIQAFGASVCFGEPASLVSNGGVYYQWVGPAGFTSTLSNATIPIVNNFTQGNYTVTVGSAHSCTNSLVVNVTAKALPTPTIIAPSKVCLHSSITLDAIGGSQYQWTGPFQFTSPNANVTFTTTSLEQTGTYTLTAFNMDGCAGRVTTNIAVNPLPDGNLTSDNANRCVPFCANFRLDQFDTVPIVSSNWQVNDVVVNMPNFHYCVSEPGDYKVSGTFQDMNGCVNTSTYLISALPTPVADYKIWPELPVEMADQVLFTSLSSGEQITKLTWNFMSNSNTSTGESATYIFDNAGKYAVSLLVKNVWGCTDTMLKVINVDSDFSIYVPNVFTPNGDDKNETFQPKGRGVVGYNLEVFDRWGERLFQTSDFETGWDGSYKDKSCQDGVYQWHLQASDRHGRTKDMKGHVTLYR